MFWLWLHRSSPGDSNSTNGSNDIVAVQLGEMTRKEQTKVIHEGERVVAEDPSKEVQRRVSDGICNACAGGGEARSCELVCKLAALKAIPTSGG